VRSAEALWLGTRWSAVKLRPAVGVLGKGQLQLILDDGNGHVVHANVSDKMTAREVYDAWNDLAWRAFVEPQLRVNVALRSEDFEPYPDDEVTL
jgi:hypothetical protein